MDKLPLDMFTLAVPVIEIGEQFHPDSQPGLSNRVIAQECYCHGLYWPSSFLANDRCPYTRFKVLLSTEPRRWGASLTDTLAFQEWRYRK